MGRRLSRDLRPLRDTGAVAVVSCALLGVAVCLGWLGADVGRGANFCEAARDGLVKQPANTVSNLGFVVAGLLVAWRAGLPSGMRRDLATAYACLVVVLGPASAAMHATQTAAGGRLDMASMYLVASFIAGYAAMRWWRRGPGFLAALFVAGVLLCLLVGEYGGSVPVFLYAGNVAFAVLLVTGVVLEALIRRRGETRLPLAPAGAALGCMLVAFAVWNASQQGLCDPDSLLQGHAVWHLLGAAAAYLLFRAYAGETVRDPRPATRWPTAAPMRQAWPETSTHGRHSVSHVPTVLDDLEWRGLIAHSTDLDALRAALAEGSVRFYVGFDPTAPSLHMGNLVQILTAKRLQEAGHTPYALVGGATGMIGDPRDSGERSLNSLDTVKEWVDRVRAQIEPFLSFEGPNAATMVNNYDWTASLSTIDFLRDVGKHFPVNRMLARDVVKSRLEAGISYTEFSYILLQSMDFLNLHRDYGVTLQFGGSDQWGNLTGGVELIRRAHGGKAHAFATPLVTKSDGTKYGKTEGGALWLDPEMLSPYSFYQFWLNAEDEKVGELLRIFTFLSREEIEDLEKQTAEKPWGRAAQKALAEQVTSLVHGEEETRRIQAASAALFGGGDLHELRTSTLAAALREAGAAKVDRAAGMPDIVALLVAAGLAKSNGEARRTVNEGGAYLNNTRVEDPEFVPSESDLIGGSWLVLRRGKKTLAGVEVG